MKPLQERFQSKYRVDEVGCWMWTACKSFDGYGHLKVGGSTKGAHRVAYELFVGPIPTGLHVCHRCDNPGCVNPDHLFLGTHRDNMTDRQEKGRFADTQGEANGNATLTISQVLEIRATYAAGGIFQQTIAKAYGVTQKTVSQIVRRESWAHLRPLARSHQDVTGGRG